MAGRTPRKAILSREQFPISVEQFVDGVCSYSSQYCNHSSISYCVLNVIGPPSIYPDYGDLPRAFAMRTYGKWWEKAPSAASTIMPQSLRSVKSQDFIDVAFEESVIPKKVTVFETYNPGSIVRIWAADSQPLTDGCRNWYLVYEAEPRREVPISRKFEHYIDKLFIATRLLRIEFNHRLLDYYTQLDAILLSGWRCPRVLDKIDLGQLEMMKSVANCGGPATSEAGGDSAGKMEPADVFPLDGLPCELLLKIVGYLDLTSLSRLARVNHKFNALATDPFLYTELNLKDYWWCAGKALTALAGRCRRLQKLDLSWSVGVVEPFNQFMSASGCRLTHLRADNVALDLPDMTQLTELSLRNWDLPAMLITPDSKPFDQLMLCSNLTRLDLYNSIVHMSLIVTILQNNRGLRHLNLGSCINLINMDLVAECLTIFNTSLESLDAWKTSSLTATGVDFISKLTNLRELDLGWSLGSNEIGDSLVNVVKNCKRLTKLFLGACRTLTQRDIISVVTHCPQLTQLDLVGIPVVDNVACSLILSNMKHLELLDINFCSVTREEVVTMQTLYPKVAIKTSETTLKQTEH